MDIVSIGHKGLRDYYLHGNAKGLKQDEYRGYEQSYLRWKPLPT